MHCRTALLVSAAALLLAGCDWFAPVGPPIDANITGAGPTNAYAYEALNMQAFDLGNTNPDVYWNFGGGATPNEVVDRTPSVTANGPGSYTCTVSAGGSTYTFTLTVTDPPPPTVLGVSVNTVYLGGSSMQDSRYGTFYAGMSGRLSAGIDPGPVGEFGRRGIPVSSWTWNLGSGAVPSTASGREPVVTAANPGNYSGTLVVGNSGGESEPFPFTYRVRPLETPVIEEVGVDPESRFIGTLRSFSLQSNLWDWQSSPPSSVSWNFGGGCSPNTSTELYPLVQNAVLGTFTGTVTASNAEGSVSRDFTYTVSTY